jgi:signal transduction histidine kinase
MDAYTYMLEEDAATDASVPAQFTDKERDEMRRFLRLVGVLA